jgi:hypothetical protein
MMFEQRFTKWKIALESGHGARKDEFRIDRKLLTEFTLPLFGEVWATKDGEPTSISLGDELGRDQAAFDGLADADVVGDQQAHRFHAQRHEKRDELVRARRDGEIPQRAERARARAET